MPASLVVARNGLVLNLSAIDIDWAWTTTFTGDIDLKGIPIRSITFKPGAANDILVIKSGADSGPDIFNEKCLDAASRTIYYGGARLPLYLDFSACTLSAGHKVMIILGGEQR